MKWEAQNVIAVCSAVGTVLAVGGILWAGVASIGGQFDQLDAKIDQLDAKVESGFIRVDTRLDDIDQRLSRVEGYLFGLESPTPAAGKVKGGSKP